MAKKGGMSSFPDYVWEQTKENLVIVIELKDVEFPLVKIASDNIYLKCVAEKERKLHEITINLFDEIETDKSIHKIDNEGVYFDLKKKKERYWPYLYLTKDPNDKINANEFHPLEFCFKKSIIEKGLLKTCNIVEDTEGQTLPEQEPENFMETLMNPLLTLVSYSRYLIHVDNPAIYKIVAKDTSITVEDIKVVVKTPNKSKINANVFANNSPNTYGIKYIPKKVGTHILNVFVKGELSLVLLATAYDINLIKIEEPKQCISEIPVNFTVDCSKAGEGDLEISVEYAFLRLPIECGLQKLDGGVFQARFVPNTPGQYYITVKYNGKPIKKKLGVTFVCDVIHFVFFSAKFPKETIFPTGEHFVYHIVESLTSSLFSLNDLKVHVVGPSEEFSVRPKQHFFLPNFFEVSFPLKEPGTYAIQTSVVGDPIIGQSSHVIKAYNNFGHSRENATLYISNRQGYSNKLVHLAKIPVDQIATFFVKCEKINETGNKITLEVIITDPGNKQVPLLMTAYGPLFVVEFAPKILGSHTITVHYNGKVVPHTPIKAKVISNKKGRGSK